MGVLTACVRTWQLAMCCAIVGSLSGNSENKCLEFDSVLQDPLSFLHLDFLNRAAFRLINCNQLSLDFCVLETTLPKENL